MWSAMPAAIAVRMILESLTPDIHIGLPGGAKLPEWCQSHKKACETALAILIGLTRGVAIVGGLEEALNGEPHKPQVLY
jgi:hypothetical protein